MEFHVALDVVQKVLSDPIWTAKARKISCKDELRMLLLEFCSENGEIIKVNKNTILLYVGERL